MMIAASVTVGCSSPSAADDKQTSSSDKVKTKITEGSSNSADAEHPGDGGDSYWLLYRRRKIRYIAVTVCLLLLVLFLCGTMLVLGNNNYSPEVVIRVLMGEKIKGASFPIGTLRLPRMLSGLTVGVAFGMAGSTFQTMLRNPLASPDIIGVTSGSSAAAIFSILVLKLSGNAVSIAAVFGGVTTAAIIYLLSKGGKFEGGRLILIGLVEAMLKAVISYLLLNASQYDVPGAFR